MLRAPRDIFNASHGETWRKLVNANPNAFEAALEASLLELVNDMPKDTNGMAQFACDAHQQVAGARKLVDIISTLHEPKAQPKPLAPKGLNYPAGI